MPCYNVCLLSPMLHHPVLGCRQGIYRVCPSVPVSLTLAAQRLAPRAAGPPKAMQADSRPSGQFPLQQHMAELNNQADTSAQGGIRLPVSSLSAVQVPPPAGVSLGARVEHILVDNDGPASQVLASALGAPLWFAEQLIEFGAVHACPVIPVFGRGNSARPAAQAGPEELQRLAALRQEALKRWGNGTEAQTPKRLSSSTAPVHRGGYIRAHVHPKRFPAAYAYDWAQRIISIGPHFVAVDKPPGICVPHTVDNVKESLIACVAKALGLSPGSLQPAHRLDVGTSGVVVLSRSAAFTTYFQALLKEKGEASAGSAVRGTGTQGNADIQNEEAQVEKVEKVYRCLSAAPPPLGRLVHWVETNVRQPGLPDHTRLLAGPDASPAARRCELEVTQVSPIQLPASWHPTLPPMTAYESHIHLITGRTHQIRVQLAAEGCPLLGDELYACLSEHWRRQGVLPAAGPAAAGNSNANGRGALESTGAGVVSDSQASSAADADEAAPPHTTPQVNSDRNVVDHQGVSETAQGTPVEGALGLRGPAGAAPVLCDIRSVVHQQVGLRGPAPAAPHPDRNRNVVDYQGTGQPVPLDPDLMARIRLFQADPLAPLALQAWQLKVTNGCSELFEVDPSPPQQASLGQREGGGAVATASASADMACLQGQPDAEGGRSWQVAGASGMGGAEQCSQEGHQGQGCDIQAAGGNGLDTGLQLERAPSGCGARDAAEPPACLVFTAGRPWWRAGLAS